MSTTMKVIKTTPGDVSPKTLVLGEDPVPTPVDRQLLIKVHYSAINRADMMQRTGNYPVPAGESAILGLECSGEVVGVGPSCEGLFKVGDMVMALLGGGGYGEYAVADERSVMDIPAVFGGDMEKAGAVPETWLTAFQIIHFVGKTQPGDYVVVHAAGSGVGLAACQLLKAHGAIPIATARTADKLSTCTEYGAAHVIDTTVHADDWSDVVKEITGGKGANVILDPIAGSYSKHNAAAIALDGRWVVYGLMGGINVIEDIGLMRTVLSKRVNLIGTTLRSRTLEYKGELVKAMSEFAFPRFETGDFKPIIDRTFPMAEAAAAHEFMTQNGNVGKIMLKVKLEGANPNL